VRKSGKKSKSLKTEEISKTNTVGRRRIDLIGSRKPIEQRRID